MAPAYRCFFLYIASMRWVTRKPPKMFTDASTSAMKPKAGRHAARRRNADRQQRADDDHRRDRIGDRHQRRVQRRRYRPHDVVADEDRQHEGRKLEDERIDRPAAGAVRRSAQCFGAALLRSLASDCLAASRRCAVSAACVARSLACSASSRDLAASALAASSVSFIVSAIIAAPCEGAGLPSAQRRDEPPCRHGSAASP